MRERCGLCAWTKKVVSRQTAFVFYFPLMKPEPQPDQEQAVLKKPYTKPEVRSERMFETMALSCGKIHPTQSQCRFNTKHS